MPKSGRPGNRGRVSNYDRGRGRGRGRGSDRTTRSQAKRGPIAVDDAGQSTANSTKATGEATSNKDAKEELGSKEEDYIWFWKPEQAYGWASQWYYAPFDGPSRLPFEPEGDESEPPTRTYMTCENWMMYHKAVLFNDLETALAILEADNPNDVRKLGRQVSNYNEEMWEMMRSEIVLQGNRAKFNAHEDIREELLNTGNKILVEASAFDRIWGVGFSAKEAFENREKWGTNLLGQALMQVRNEILSGISSM